jgi:spore coat polysaccharide biosynthesis protein SpsF
LVKIIGVTQARVGSTRLPNKILLKINDVSILEYHLLRITKSKFVNNWIIATTHEDGVESILSIANKLKIKYFQGDTNNVLNRFFQAVKNEAPDFVVRVTSDCPLIDPTLIDEVVSYAIHNDFDYCSTSDNFPDGFDVEIFRFKELVIANENAILNSDKEHVTPFIKKQARESKRYGTYSNSLDFHNIRLTIDELSDFDAVSLLINNLGPNQTWEDYTKFVTNNLDLFPNQSIIRNQGYLESLKKDK